MAQIHLLVAGVMLCSLPACSLDRDLPWIHSLEKQEIFMLLRQLERIPSQSCLKDRTDFKFPWGRENIPEMQRTEDACFHHEMLQQIINLFNTKDSHAAWKNTLLEQLLSRLDHGLERLEQMEGENLACPSLGIIVRKYFQRIYRFLKEKKFTLCAWEIVRVEMKRCLSIM
ncbi:interferon alpha-2-like [Equus asinus]|uniref:Uncharacterized protein n=1 Tax=Equus asinus TaxID=9793 RepID=A0A8C4MY28_EQUAS|nr:interferon alpha-6-like [Equus asinus]XP_046519788.1 interferon alpha-6-like [Equus quagga]